MGLKLNTASSGSVTIEPTNTASNYTLTVPATNATLAINGPAFSAYLSTNQSISNVTFTKVQCNTEEFDTNNNYDNSTNYRFTPTVAGYYMVTGATQGTGATTNYETLISIYKNGSEFKRGGYVGISAGSGTASHVVASALIYFNGTTDYVELYAYYGWSGGAGALSGTNYNTYFQASLVRAA